MVPTIRGNIDAADDFRDETDENKTGVESAENGKKKKKDKLSVDTKKKTWSKRFEKKNCGKKRFLFFKLKKKTLLKRHQHCMNDTRES